MNENGVLPTTAASTTRASQSGPPLLIPAAAFGVLTIAAVVLGAPGPRPGDSGAQTLRYDLAHHSQLIALAVLVFGAAMPLAIWAAIVFQRLRRLGVLAPGTAMALLGGVLAAASLALSGILTWTIAESADGSTPELARALTLLAFASGGAGFVVPLALLIAGVAVPAVVLHLLPRALACAGLVLAAAGMVATLALVTSALYPLLPIVRFGGLVWLVAVSVLLPHDRVRRSPAGPITETRTVAAAH